ncbi:MAG: spore maturation protein [Oscillospiraceae bacterium]|jgi:spore maturation protein B|nr:spore maturation protein [Oscillospiraceae bacterium]
MNAAFALSVPLILLCVGGWAMHRGVDLAGALTAGAGDGLRVLVRILPTLVMLLTGIHMLRASGALDLATRLLAPWLGRAGIPAACAPLVLLRPFSGGGALAMGAELMRTYGADSPVGRTAAVMLGSSETTFYAVGVYFGAAGVVRGRYTLIAALLADVAGFLAAAWSASWLFPA